MTPPESLEDKIRSPGFTPRKRDGEALIALVRSADEDVAKFAARALERLGADAANALPDAFAASEPRERPRFVALAGRLLRTHPDEALRAFLEARLADPDPVVRRRAVTAFGKLGDERAERLLLGAIPLAASAADVRAFALALGHVGREGALAWLRGLDRADPDVARAVVEAEAKIERTLLRATPTLVHADRPLPRPMRILVHVRRGLEGLLVEELGKEARPADAGEGRVLVVTDEPLARLFRARTFLHFGFPLTVPPDAANAEEAVAGALASDETWELVSALTEPPVRYRVEWASGGRRRAGTFALAERVRGLRAGLVNDPTRAPWEAVVTEKPGSPPVVELWPNGLVDPRFSYRKRTLPAASHPTIAAALARVAGVVPDDVVWDPFVGSGMELCERALLGPARALLGTDLDAAALDAARENLAHATRLVPELGVADARTHRPSLAPSLVITNPPFGRRVLERDDLAALFDGFFANVARVLTDSGRVVWVSPLPPLTVSLARKYGLVAQTRLPVDIGGVPGEIQAFVRSKAR